MKVKIVKCSLADTVWYADKIDKCFNVRGTLWQQSGKEFWVLEDDVSLILKDDAEVVEDKASKFPFKVRCTDNVNAEERLVEGRIYTVLSDYEDVDYILDGVALTWSKRRFEIIPDEPVVKEDHIAEALKMRDSLRSLQVAKTAGKVEEYTGGSVSYYSVPVNNPTDPNKSPYVAECNDLIEALGMNYAEGNAFKAIWRSCAARAFGNAKKGYDEGLYDAEKVVFFGQRMVAMAKK